MSNSSKIANNLIHETSPYLLQHAYNPVNWIAYNDEAFKKATLENKLVLISIGYSACHWCHVMEHECFEDLEIAKLMNENFINIKVDREERSDVDMLYMQAVQLMTGQGGWPLNCFVLPNRQPFYGGTYFNKQQWKSILENLSMLQKEDPLRISRYATELTEGIKKAELINTQKKDETIFSKKTIQQSIKLWKTKLDNEYGGPNKAPKFPLPSNYLFLLRYAVLEKDDALLNHVTLTLQKMAFGGIYDQLHGGFSRYSTDSIWKIPHFEKMLYDNAQLISLYCEAYTITKNELYKKIAIETLAFIESHWYQKEGFFHSAYDADSEGEEGKYYVWNKLDLKDLLGNNYNLFSNYFLINEEGYWEYGNYILMRTENILPLLAKFNITLEALEQKIELCKSILKQEAKSRIMPGLDDKTITSWNTLMCSAFAKAYLVFGDINYKTIAISSIQFILKKLTQSDGKLYRTFKNGNSKIDGFLEDYAFTIEALINCYLISQEEFYLLKAKETCEFALENFKNNESEFLFYTHNDASDLIVKTTEISDNVIPASNSQMAINLFQLGIYFNKQEWILKSKKMLELVSDEFKNYGSGYSNWGCLALNVYYPFKEIAIVGKDVNENLISLYQHGITNTILAVSNNKSDLPLLKNRYVINETLFYVCENNTCKKPVNSIENVLLQFD